MNLKKKGSDLLSELDHFQQLLQVNNYHVGEFFIVMLDFLPVIHDMEDSFTSRANWMQCEVSTDFLSFCICANVWVGWLIRRMDYLG